MFLIIKIMGDAQNRMRTVHRKLRISSLQPETHRNFAVFFWKTFLNGMGSQIHINIKNGHRRSKGTSSLLLSPSNNIHVCQEQWRQNAGRAHASARDARWRIKPKLGKKKKCYWRYLMCPILTYPILNTPSPSNTWCLRTGCCGEYLDLSVRKWREAVQCRRLHSEELRNLYASPNVVRVIKSRRMRWAGHVAQMGELRNAYHVPVGKPGGKRQLRRRRRGL
jgi:hypothetical protein